MIRGRRITAFHGESFIRITVLSMEWSRKDFRQTASCKLSIRHLQ